ncbi:MAG TPA: hypothetical protein VJN18_04075 [Polyangiaceae bacterium]|nr:hypothetical protein [Polyangiaceae bacterium]
MWVKRRTLDPKLDIVFWMLFGVERNRDLLISLLTAVLDWTPGVVSAESVEAVLGPAGDGTVIR